MIEIEILNTNIFPSDIISGVTMRNQSAFQPYGFTISGNYSDENIVNQHRKLMSEYLNLELDAVKYQKQVHGDEIQVVDFDTEINESDAMITNLMGLALVASVADCAAILLYDDKVKAIAAIHSGWRSTTLNIVSKTIEKMRSEYNSKPQDLIAYISPCAGGDSYEVGIDVAQYFPNSIKRLSQDKFLFNIKNEVHNQLIVSGVPPQNIEMSEICTISNEKFHSFRRDADNSGRMGAFIMMKGAPND
ncbi:MAG: peptidoglycan editing factor PgeF [Ignavibacteriae bacterium HGW-Ignavibacteriae-1]|jgi:hypothetical protein|nr:MAG: peptidoglycan editing factor PgeF [Ignavibacteriae bacterium HGW-Ignavibacteriae-1]